MKALFSKDTIPKPLGLGSCDAKRSMDVRRLFDPCSIDVR